MKWETDEYKETPPWISKAIKIAVVVILVVAVGFAVYWMASQKAGVKRAQKIATIDLVPPPPPPPPPKQEEPPPPEERVIEEPKPQDKPQEAPPQQLTIAGEAQAGGDNFGIQAGTGGGMTLGGTPTGGGVGGGLNNAFSDSAYRRYLSATLTQQLQSDSRLNRQVFTADVNLWMDGRRVTRATIARSTGNPKTDAVLMAALQGTTVDEAPTGPMRFPQRVVVRGRRGL